MRKAISIILGIAGSALLIYIGMVTYVAVALMRLDCGNWKLTED